ncbi:hypothetical protein TcasGA2_TC033848 [Tribolium castaneum]|uniref:Uncharacterized protein n=1 Tax=Tribolium castaneum TaxID=7070 RepID=A0A139WF84_TRICA|nr:PREDICTED: uncharacterized protein LOC103313812 [Tribolium castaneum]KYB26529.1 hypothetical protein TcasGA2_TC033848 [Tribolium castaneum]|eukprot:XP_015837157.1 PREDICTED: uncharacterized protein LOC103313812 [Tribolium castaneum]
MTKLLYIITIYCLLGLITATQGEYVAPRSIGYPFGDEVLNADISEDRVQEEPREISVEIIKDIYTFCPNKSDDEEDRFYEELPYNDNSCSKCDVRPTVDKTGVLVECYNCSDVSMLTTATDDFAPGGHILFLTTFLEIANYTASTEDT